MWFNTAGKMLQLETPGTLRARELGEIYMILASDADEDGTEGEERLAALHSLATLVRNIHLGFVSTHTKYNTPVVNSFRLN